MHFIPFNVSFVPRCQSVYPLIRWHILFGAAASCVPSPASFCACYCQGRRCYSPSDSESRICTGHHPLLWVQSGFIANVWKHCNTVIASRDKSWKYSPCLSTLMWPLCLQMALFLCMSLYLHLGFVVFFGTECKLSFSSALNNDVFSG